MVSAVAAAVMAPAGAQQPAARHGGLEEVTVTARRVEESLQTVPLAISALTGTALTEKGIVKMEDLGTAVPSLTFSSTSRGAAAPFVSIRGLRNFDIALAGDPAVAFYFDEVGQQRPNGVNMSMFDIRSVEIAKGPQGTLFGRNTTGGAIIIRSNEPETDAIKGYAQVQGGNLNYHDFEGALNVPINDWAAIRVGGKITRRDGFMTNLSTGQDTSDLHSEGWRVRLKLTPTDTLSSTFSVSAFHENSNGLGRQSIAPLANPIAGAFAAPTATDPRSVQDDLRVSANSPYEYLSDEYSWNRTNVFDASNITELEIGETFLGDLTLKNILGYRWVKTDTAFDFDGTQFTATWLNGITDVQQASNELQLVGTRDNLEWIVGATYFLEWGKDNNYNAVAFNRLPPRIIVASVLPTLVTTAAPLGLRQLTGSQSQNSSYSFFGHGKYTMPWNDKLSLSAGVRVTTDGRRVRNYGFNGTACRLTTAAAGGTVLPNNRCYLVGAETYTEPTYNVSLDYQFTDKVLGYVAHRHGYRSGGFNNRGVNPETFGPFNPEFVDDIEVGAKADFQFGNWPGRINAAYYYMWYKDVQRTVSFIVPGTTTFVSSILNAASANLWGVEAELTLELSENLTLSGFMSLNYNEYNEWTESTSTGVLLDRSANEFDYAPKQKGGFTLNWRVPYFDSAYGDLTLQANYYAQSYIEDEVLNNPRSRYDGYGLLNLRADWTSVMNSNFDLAFFINNATDEVYFAGGTSNQSIGLHAWNPGAPLTYGVQLKYNYGE
ncbi:MAG: TonB-dependent receptor [Gammaproteobacteria bacterium]